MLWQRNDRQSPALARFLTRLPELSAGYDGVNPFWRSIIEEVPELSGHDAVEQAWAAINGVSRISYGFEELPKGTAFTDEPGYQRVAAIAERWARKKRAREAFLRGELAQDFTKLELEHAFGLSALHALGLHGSYEDFLAPLGIRSSYQSTRNYAYLRWIDESLTEAGHEGPVDVVEVGGGSANLACFLARAGRLRSYTSVDLPVMLFMAACTVGRYFPEAALAFEDDAVEPEAGRFQFLAPQFKEAVPDGVANLAVNVHSFMEMDEGVRDDYFDWIYRVAKPGALFFNANWVQAMTRLDGTEYVNSPLWYPYRPSDRLLRFEEDEYHGILRRTLLHKNTASLAFVNARVIA